MPDTGIQYTGIHCRRWGLDCRVRPGNDTVWLGRPRLRTMVKIAIWGSLRAATGGRAEVEVAAGTLRELLDRLAEAYPGLRPQIERGVSISIDGLVYNDSWFTPVKPDSEVVLLPRIVGG
jgi:molybdopterin converting factor small subunit